MNKTAKTTIIRSDRKTSMLVFEAIIGVAAFCALYLTLISSLPFNAALYGAMPIGAALVAVLIVFNGNKYVKYGALITSAVFVVLALSAGFGTFKDGWLGALNGAISKMNETRHYGYASFAVRNSIGADFLFACVAAVVLATFSAVAVRKSYVYICVSSAITIALLCIGLYPEYYSAGLLVLVFVCLLTSYNGFTLKAVGCYMICALIVILATIPCYFFEGSKAVSDFGESIVLSVENMLYGNSLPSGRLDESYGMRSSDKVRLKLTLSPLTTTLYLKGFVGSDLVGSEWQPTDKNVYVQNGYQGLLDYIYSGGLPVTQYAEYSKLCRHSNKYSLTVTNVSADRRYVYAPYTLSAYSEGEAYYDMGLRGGVFASDTYTHTIFAADESGERVTQAEWITVEDKRTVEMDEYMLLEGQYRAFVYDTYSELNGKTESAVSDVLDGFETTSVNTATQFIRAYFLDEFTYTDKCDKISGDFATEFFGGNIRNANAAYFATAATLMFRSLGFASRYVEGYSVRVDDDLDTTEESLSVTVYGSSTHAWSEVYFDGIGWLPIEVTPTFFTEQPPDVTVDPEDPSDIDNNPGDTDPTYPDKQPETPPDVPDIPDKPIPTPDDGNKQTSSASRLTSALKVLVPIVSVILGILLVILLFVVRQYCVRHKRRKSLNADGEASGRAAYRIMEHDCKHFGGFDSAVLEKYGITENSTARFMRAVERCVYGGYAMDEDDRKFMIWYIGKAQSALISSCGFFRAVYCKHILCMVI